MASPVVHIYPILPISGRAAVINTALPLGGGSNGKFPFFMSAGTGIINTIYAMGRRKDLFGDDTEIFRAKRYEALRPG
jgi:hypothetical protein